MSWSGLGVGDQPQTQALFQILSCLIKIVSGPDPTQRGEGLVTSA